MTRSPSERCETCRYWSQMIAMVEDGVLRALCLSPDQPQRYMTETNWCSNYKPNVFGTVDEPPRVEDLRRIHDQMKGEST